MMTHSAEWEALPLHARVAGYCLRQGRPVKRQEVQRRFALSRSAVARVFRLIRERQDCYQLAEAGKGYVWVVRVLRWVAARPSRAKLLAQRALAQGGEVTVCQAAEWLALDERAAEVALRNIRFLQGLACRKRGPGLYWVWRDGSPSRRSFAKAKTLDNEAREEARVRRANALLQNLWRR